MTETTRTVPGAKFEAALDQICAVHRSRLRRALLSDMAPDTDAATVRVYPRRVAIALGDAIRDAAHGRLREVDIVGAAALLEAFMAPASAHDS